MIDNKNTAQCYGDCDHEEYSDVYTVYNHPVNVKDYHERYRDGKPDKDTC